MTYPVMRKIISLKSDRVRLQNKSDTVIINIPSLIRGHTRNLSLGLVPHSFPKELHSQFELSEWNKILSNLKQINQSVYDKSLSSLSVQKGNRSLFEGIPSWFSSGFLEGYPFGFLIGRTEISSEIPRVCSYFRENLKTIYKNFKSLKQKYGEVPLGDFDPFLLVPHDPVHLLLVGSTGKGKTKFIEALEKEIDWVVKELIKNNLYKPLTIILKVHGEQVYPVLETYDEAKKIMGALNCDSVGSCFSSSLFNAGHFLNVHWSKIAFGALNAFFSTYLALYWNRMAYEYEFARESVDYCHFSDIGFVSRSAAYDTGFVATAMMTQLLLEAARIFGGEALFLILFELLMYKNKGQQHHTGLLFDPIRDKPIRVEGGLSVEDLVGEQLDDSSIPIQNRFRPGLAALSLGRVLHFENLNALPKDTLECFASMITNHSFELAGNPGWVIPFFPLLCSSTNDISGISPSILDRSTTIVLKDTVPYEGIHSVMHLLLLIKYQIEKRHLLPFDDTVIPAYLDKVITTGFQMKLSRFTCEQIFEDASALAKKAGRDYFTAKDLNRAWTAYEKRD